MHDTSAQVPGSAVGPFSVLPLLSQRFSPRVSSLVAPTVDGALALSRLDALYARAVNVREDRRLPFWNVALEMLNVTLDVSAHDLDRIPRSGPLVVVANHPFGGLDGLALLAMLHRVRGDVRVFGNRLLQQIPDLGDALILVDAFAGRGAVRANGSSLRRGLRWLTEGHVLAVFPAGEVSHFELQQRAITDPPWHSAAGRLAQLGEATVVPVFFHGTNSRLFQSAGLVHERLRTLLLPREALKRQNSVVEVAIGGPIPPTMVRRLGNADELTAYLRARTFVLRGRPGGTNAATPEVSGRPSRSGSVPGEPAA